MARQPDNANLPESEAEARIIRDVLCTAQVQETQIDGFDELLEKRGLRRALRVAAWIHRFARNCRNEQKQHGPLTTPEVNEVRTW